MGALRRAVSALARQHSRAFASNVNQTYGAPAETFKRKVRETARGIYACRDRTSTSGLVAAAEVRDGFARRRRVGAPRPPADAATAGTTDGSPSSQP